ncbi:hypothetical protein Tco_0873166 [Tanacetum coccineum]
MVEEPCWESTALRTMELVWSNRNESTNVSAPNLCASVPMRGPVKEGASYRLGLELHHEEETPDASPTLAAKEVTETPPPNATSDPMRGDALLLSPHPKTGPRPSEGIASGSAFGGVCMVTAQQALGRLAQALRQSPSSLNARTCEEKNGTACQIAGGEEKLRNSVIEYDRGAVPSHVSTIVFGASGHKPWFAPCCHVPVTEVPWVIQKAYEELVAAMEAMKLLELPHITQLETLDSVLYLSLPVRPRDILNPFALEKEIPLKESLEAHAIRLAKKKGVKGKAILCGVGAAHIPRSDGVPVSVATVSPKDSELLGKLEEAGDAAYQVGSSEQSRCHSI